MQPFKTNGAKNPDKTNQSELPEGWWIRLLPDAVGSVLQGRHALLCSRDNLQPGEGYLRLSGCKLGE